MKQLDPAITTTVLFNSNKFVCFIVFFMRRQRVYNTLSDFPQRVSILMSMDDYLLPFLHIKYKYIHDEAIKGRQNVY